MGKRKNVFTELLYKNGIYLVIEIISSYIVTQSLLIGNQKISEAIDRMLSGTIWGYMDAKFWLFMLFLVIAGFVFTVVQNVSTRKFAVNMLAGFRRVSAKRVMEQQYRYFDSHSSAQVLNHFISDSQKLAQYYSENLPNMITCLVNVGVILIAIARVDMMLTLLLVVLVPVMTFISRYANKKVSYLTGRHWELVDEVNEMAYDGLQGMEVVRGFCLESALLRKIKEANERLLRYEYKRNAIQSISWLLGDLVTNMPGILLGMIALLRVLAGYITAGEMAYFLLLLDRVVHPLGTLPGLFMEAKVALVSKERLEQLLEHETEHSGETDFQTDLEEIIRFEDVVFSYHKKEEKESEQVKKGKSVPSKTVLKGCSFSVKKGENVAFIGKSGGGKSTLFKLLCGLYEPSAGSIHIMGRDIVESDLKALREHIAIVSQDCFLFPKSIAWNVACGMDDVTKEQVVEACKKAQIHDFIMTLPQGYETNVGERGNLLSGGQKQRVAIARALIKNADIILFDEPTAAVDVENENLIKKAMKEAVKGKTILTIAHRLNTIQDADRIYVLEDGTLREQSMAEKAAMGIQEVQYE